MPDNAAIQEALERIVASAGFVNSPRMSARAWEMPMLKVSPVFDRLRSDPRFPQLLDRVGVPG